MIWILVLTLAILQGFTELLPVSSSGHLVVGESIFRAISPSASLCDLHKSLLSISLHFGTLIAIVFFYRDRVWRLVTRDYRLLALIFVGSLPAAIIGIAIKCTNHHSILHLPEVAGFGFLVTGAILWFGARDKQTNENSDRLQCDDLSFRAAIGIGFAQALAILPGISRSGTTIVAGLRLGLRREESACFSFLLAIPVIAGAMILEIPNLIAIAHGDSPLSTSSEHIRLTIVPLLVGMLVSAVIAYLALGWLVRWLRGGKLHRFAWYVIPLGAAVLIWRLTVHLG